MTFCSSNSVKKRAAEQNATSDLKREGFAPHFSLGPRLAFPSRQEKFTYSYCSLQRHLRRACP